MAFIPSFTSAKFKDPIVLKTDDQPILKDKIEHLNSWVLQNVKKKTCVKFIKNPRSLSKGEVCFCGYRKEQHPKLSQPSIEETEWNPEKHVKELPTDAFGYFTFKGAGKDIKKVVECGT